MIRGTIWLILSMICSAAIANGRTIKTYHDDLTSLQTDTLVVLPRSDAATLFKAIELRGALPRKPSRTDRNSFSILWAITDPDNYAYATLTADDYQIDDLATPALTITIGRKINGTDSTIESLQLTKGVDTNGGENSLAVEITQTEVRLLAGHKTLNEIYSAPSDSPHDPDAAVGFQLSGHVSLSMIVTEQEPDPKPNVATGWDAEKINDYFAEGHRQAPEGLWKYLDRNNDPAYARPGGFYRLAIIRRPASPDFDIIYMDGAETASDSWQTGMLKGRLSPTAFSGHYDLQWFDSSMNIVDAECSATIESPAIIRFDFPLLKSSMRFSVLPQGM